MSEQIETLEEIDKELARESGIENLVDLADAVIKYWYPSGILFLFPLFHLVFGEKVSSIQL